MDNKWLFFSEEETRGLAPELVALLDRARHIAGIPFSLTSTVRSSEENSQVGGIKSSAHEKGWAVDIRAHSSTERFLILCGLFSVGFKRIGLYDSHIHADIDSSKPQNVLWMGRSH